MLLRNQQSIESLKGGENVESQRQLGGGRSRLFFFFFFSGFIFVTAQVDLYNIP